MDTLNLHLLIKGDSSSLSSVVWCYSARGNLLFAVICLSFVACICDCNKLLACNVRPIILKVWDWLIATETYKMLSYRRETALQGALQFSPKVEDWNWETIFYGHYRSIFNHCDIIGLKICRIPWKKRKIRLLRRSRSFKVIEVGTNRKTICDFLLVINNNWQPISYRFGVIAAYCSNFALTRLIWLKISSTRGRLPPIIFARIVRPMNALQLCPWQSSHWC